jgi:hypothetical protein
LEYASPVWDPHQITTTRDIEQVQRRAARFAYNCYQDNSTGCVTNLPGTLITMHFSGWKHIWVIFQKMKTLCDIEGEISNRTNWHNFGRKIMSIRYIFQIQLLSANSVSLIYWNCFLMVYTKFGTKMCLFHIIIKWKYIRSLTIAKRKWYLWGSKSVFVIILTLVCPCNVYDVWWNWRLPGTLITMHFSGWKHIWVIFQKMKTLCDIEGEISNWTN